ncbi:hypothetical protein [Rhizobium sp. 1399]|uniref:hypothetical protein n=1 Tax=Rhizobium sp. 1399 TaxID=2817758 RepID=UPI00286235E8|nr:hypothetical protein [Rhizobium sp. 1399]MDR6671255.1 putative membrane protein YedE/YeeE [Rhizobium sp. 1399]
MEELLWKMAMSLGAIVLIIAAFGALHSVVETKTGYEPFTRQKLTLLSFTAALFHGAFYLQDQTAHLAGKPWAFPAMVAGAAILAVYIVLQNFRKAGWLWGAVVTAAQSLILVALGPMFGAMLALFLFRGLTKNWRGSGFSPNSPAPQPNFLYPANPPY